MTGRGCCFRTQKAHIWEEKEIPEEVKEFLVDHKTLEEANVSGKWLNLSGLGVEFHMGISSSVEQIWTGVSHPNAILVRIKTKNAILVLVLLNVKIGARP
jgi:hypothetical protein